ncbi:DUF4340 domain-containing protein [Tundrisphaera lichenicola]|uniref:DUF4340 domain-containing protein n=1 Tax=Tundrisphaera lichenicola TaxID=2029860 RepID=UPI003EBD47E6
MNHRGTYALLALFFAGLCGLWVADYAQLPTSRTLARQRSRILHELIDTKPDDLRKIEILGGEAPMAFERRDGNRWQMTAPEGVAADPSMVETLAFNLKELTRKPEAGTLEADPATYGLAPPERTIRLWGASTDEPLATLQVGKISLDRRFVRSAGSEGVEVVDARGLDLLRLPPVRWRDRELFRVPSFEVDAVRIANPQGEIKLRRDPDSWRIVAPIRTLAAEQRVDGLIADLGSLRVLDDSRFVALDVPAADLDRYGLKTPALTIEVEAGREGRRRPTQSIQIGKSVEGNDALFYVRRGDQDDILAIDSRVLKGLGIDLAAYRSPKVADINPARVLGIGFEGEAGAFQLARSGRDWMISQPSRAPADRRAVEDFLKGLGDLQTSIYPTPAAVPDSGLDHPSTIIKIWQSPDPRVSTGSSSADTEGELALSLKIGRRDASKRSIYAQLEGDRTILALPDTSGDLLFRNALSFRDRVVLSIESGQIEHLKFSGSNRKIELRAPILKLDPLMNAPIGWWMVEPVEAPAEPTSVGKLLKLLSGLRADGLVLEIKDPGELKSYGLDEPVMTVTWSVPAKFSMVEPSRGPDSGEPPFDSGSLLVGSSVPGRSGLRFAKVADRPLVFTIGPATIGILDAEYHEQRVLAFDPDRVTRLRLNWPDRSLSLMPSGPVARREWLVEGPVVAPEFDPSRVTPLVNELSRLSTSRFLQYQGEIPKDTGITSPRLSIRVETEATSALMVRVGVPAGNGLVCASTAISDDGPVFLLPEALFGGWLKTPRQHDDLPENVFAP